MTEGGADASPLVLDATCLSHFARADRLGVLRDLLVGRRCWTTEIVLAELNRGLVDYPMLRHVFEQEWLLVAGLDSIAEIRLYDTWRKRAGSAERDQGEARVFAAIAAEIRRTAGTGQDQSRATVYVKVHGRYLSRPWQVNERSMACGNWMPGQG